MVTVMAIDWDDIRLLQKVGETGSFSKAAIALHTSQPTVSRRMQRLQERLQVTLFERKNKGLRLSSQGEVLYDLAQEMVQNANSFEIAARSLAQQTHVVRLACSPLTGLALGPYLNDLCEGLSNVKIALLTSVDFVSLEKGEADIAIRNVRPEKGNLLLQSVGTHSFGIYANREISEKYAVEIETGNFSKCPWVGYHQNMSHLPSSKWLAQNYGITQPDIQLDNSLLILGAIEKGMGFAILPSYIGAYSNLIAIKKPLKGLSFESWLLSHSQSSHDPVILKIKERLKVQLQNIFSG